MSTHPAWIAQPRLSPDDQCELDTNEARLRLAAMATIASSLANELAQPLTAAANYSRVAAGLLRKSKTESKEVLEMVEQAAQQTVKAGEIIRGLTRFVTTGRVTGRRESLGAMIDNATAIQAFPGGSKLKIVQNLDEDASFALVERVQIEHVFVSLLRQASSALDVGGLRRVRIRALLRGDEVVITISHSGPRLSRAALNQMFETDYSPQTDVLSICRMIVEAHGGKIWAEPGANGGARFYLTLRAAD